MMEFPASTLIRFFHNHGFLGLSTQHQWKTVVNGSRTYADIITKPYKDKIRLNSGIEKVRREKGVVKLIYKGGSEEIFDKVIFACHADTALSLLESPSNIEGETLKQFHYEKNIATLHTDSSVMPNVRSAWSAWNYRVEKNDTGGWKDSNIIYWMNALQGVSESVNYFISINDPGLVREERVLRRIEYDHPLFTTESVAAQKKLPELNKQGDIYYCGSYFRYGFHEDAFMSAVDLSQILSKEPIWN
jgi:predicted NAD/FAD-binding protein